MKIIITGVLGFIGSHLARAFVHAGDEVIGIDNYSRPIVDEIPGVICIKGSIANAFMHHTWMGVPDLIIHCASPVGAAAMRPETETLWQIIRDAHEVFDFAKMTGAKVIAFSTPEVYGYEADMLNETHRLEIHLPYTPRHEYPIGKIAMECMGFVHPHPFIHFIRPYIVSGPGQNQRSGAVLPRFVHAAVYGSPLTIFGTGEQRRQFTHIDDLVSFVVMLKGGLHEVWGAKQIWNVGGPDDPISIKDLAERVIRVAGRGSIVMADPVVALHNPHFVEAPEKFVDIAKARSTGWSPKKGLNEIIKDMVDDARMRAGIK